MPARPDGMPAGDHDDLAGLGQSFALRRCAQAYSTISDTRAVSLIRTGVNTPGQRQPARDGHVGRQAQDRGRRPLACRPERRRAGCRVGDDRRHRQQRRCRAHAVADRVGDGRRRLRMGGVGRRAVIGVAFHLRDDPVHHPHRLQRVAAGSRFRREHDGVGALVHGGRHVGGLGPGGGRRLDHGFQHLGRDHHRLAGAPAGAQHPALDRRHLFGRHLDAEIAARDHHGVGAVHDLFEPVDGGRFFELRHDRGLAAHQLAQFVHVLRTLDERQGHPVDAEFEREGQVAAVLFGQRRNRQDRADDADALALGNAPCRPGRGRWPTPLRPARPRSRTLPSSTSRWTPGDRAAKISGCGSGTRSRLPGVGSRSRRMLCPSSSTNGPRPSCRAAASAPAGRPGRRSGGRSGLRCRARCRDAAGGPRGCRG